MGMYFIFFVAKELDPFCSRSICIVERSAEITKRITSFIVKDMRPINTVNGEGFIEMMSPSLSFHFIKSMYSAAVSKLYQKFQSCDQVCLTEDVWTSSAMEAYHGITAHLISICCSCQTP